MPEPWGVTFANRAGKELAGLPRRDQEAVARVIGRLRRDPGTVDIKKLEGSTEEWRLRSGALRIIFTFDHADHRIRIERVLPRSSAYRR